MGIDSFVPLIRHSIVASCIVSWWVICHFLSFGFRWMTARDAKRPSHVHRCSRLGIRMGPALLLFSLAINVCECRQARTLFTVGKRNSVISRSFGCGRCGSAVCRVSLSALSLGFSRLLLRFSAIFSWFLFDENASNGSIWIRHARAVPTRVSSLLSVKFFFPSRLLLRFSAIFSWTLLMKMLQMALFGSASSVASQRASRFCYRPGSSSPLVV
jgi:hypothetical protein